MMPTDGKIANNSATARNCLGCDADHENVNRQGADHSRREQRGRRHGCATDRGDSDCLACRARGRVSYVVLHHPGAAVLVVERIADRAALDRHWRVIAGCVHASVGFIALSCV